MKYLMITPKRFFKIIILSPVFFSLAGAGCVIPVQKMFQTSISPRPVSNFTNQLQMTTTIIHQKDSPTDPLAYAINAEVPQLTAGLTSTVMTAINTSLKKHIQQLVDQFKISAEDKMESDVPDKSEVINNGGEPMSSTLDVTSTTLFTTPRFVSFKSDVSIFFSYRSEHPLDTFFTATYDRASGQEVALADLFKNDPGYLQQIAQLSRKKLMAQADVDSVSYVLETITNGTAPNNESFKNFTVSPGFLTIYFDQYQVGSGADGTQQVDIPWSELQDLESESGRVSLKMIEVNQNLSATIPGIEVCDFSITYPEAQAGNGISDLAEARIKFVIREIVNKDYGANLEAAATQYLDQCRQAARNKKQWPVSKSYYQSWDVTLNQNGLLSFAIIPNWRGDGVAQSLNIDLTTGRKLTLQDIVKSDKLLAFFLYEKKQLLAEEDPKEDRTIYNQTRAAIQKLSADAKSLSPEDQRKEFGSFDNFYLTPQAMVTYYKAEDTEITDPVGWGYSLKVVLPYGEINDFVSTSTFNFSN